MTKSKMSKSNWMGRLPNKVKDLPFNKILMPGTHNSGSYNLDWKKSKWNTMCKVVSLVSKIKAIGKFIGSWTLCQQQSLLQQLNLGARSFDFRLSFDSKSNKFYITHTFTCVEMSIVMDDILNFLLSNPEEIIIINIKPDWENRNTMNGKNDVAIAQLREKFRGLLCPTSGKFPTYRQMIKSGNQVVLVYDSTNRSTYYNIWSARRFDSPWKSTSNINKKLSYLDQDLQSFAPNTFNTLGFYLTPQTTDVISSLGSKLVPCKKSNNLHTFGIQMQDQLDDFIRDYGLGNTSCISFDYITDSVSEKIISLNN